MNSRYYLKNKDKSILAFKVISKKIEVLGKNDYTQEIDDIAFLDDSYLPYGLSRIDTKKSLSQWIKNRKVPKNREFVEQIVSSYSSNNNDMLMDYIDVSLGLSLNDSFWIVPDDGREYLWKDYNLYDNEFDNVLSLVAFNGDSYKIKDLTTSPEYTTNGMLRKCWVREEDGIYLYKGCSKEYANWGKEAYAEYYMSQIAETLDLDHINYDLKRFHGQIVSSCRLFTDENIGYIPIYHCLKEDKKNLSSGELLNEIAKIYGKDRLKDLLVFDAIIGNTDRHLGNFGMLVDNDTGEFIRPAPIFDNGFSVMNHVTKAELKNIDEAMENKISYFGYPFKKQLELFLEPKHLMGLEKLANFRFRRHSDVYFSEEWLSAIEKHINNRAVDAIDILNNLKNEISERKQDNVERVARVRVKDIIDEKRLKI